MSGYFIYDGIDTRTLGVDVFPASIDDAPAREFQVINVPGRNGAVILDNAKYSNVDRSYWVLIRSNIASTYQTLRGLLLSRKNYCRLTDSWFTDEYYMAYVYQPIRPIMPEGRDLCKFLVTFSRKPQRFLTSGETAINATATTPGVPSISQSANRTTLTNPTYFAAKPLLVFTFPNTTTFSNRYFYLGGTSLTNTVSGKPRPQINYKNYLYLDTLDDETALSTIINNTMSIAVDTESKSCYVVGTNTYLNNLLVVSSSARTITAGSVVYTITSEFTEAPGSDAGWKYVFDPPTFSSGSAPDVNIAITPRWYSI